MRRIIIIQLAILLVVFSCKNKTNKEVQQKSEKERDSITKELSFYADTNNRDIFILNDKAVKLLEESQRAYTQELNIKDSLLNEALKYLNLAISLDSNFYDAYLNKSAVLRGLGKYQEAIAPLQELLRRKSYPEGIFTLGLLYEKMGNERLANEQYKKALEAYEKRLKTPLATVRDEINKEYVLLFLEGKEKSLKRINQRIKEDPNNQDLKASKEIIEEFDREEFINSI